MKPICSLLVLVVCLVFSPTLKATETPPPLGATIPELAFKDIRYVRRTLADLGPAEAYVVVFTNTTCPLVQKYWPKLKRLEAEFRAQGVKWIAVNTSSEDSIAEVAQQGIDFGVEFPLVKDVDGACVAATGVSRTPEVVVLDKRRVLVYRGRIDDQHRVSGTRPQVGADNLRDALVALCAGKGVEPNQTPVDGCLISLPTKRMPRAGITFHKDVAPLLQRHCQDCHHRGGNAPSSLVTFEEVAAQGAMVAEVVGEQRMPPWYASRRHQFANERGLTSAERRVIADWIAGGSVEGDPATAPAPREFHDEKWEIGQPDLVATSLETHSLPADGFVDYKYVVLPHVFLYDTWISAAEILPSNPAVVHHCNLAYWTLGQSFDAGNFITGRVPGGTAMKLDDGVALKIPRGSVIGLQIHYTTTGKPETNRMSVGFKFPRQPVKKQLHHLQVTTSRFAVPPGAAAYEVKASRTLPCDATGVGMFSHMHLRGKDMTFAAHRPEQTPETLLSIPNYHYDWQQNYRWKTGAARFPRGTRIEVTAHYDNSAFNPFNPDATVEVPVGPQTIHEMMFGFFFYTDDGEQLNIEIDPRTGGVAPASQSASQSSSKAQESSHVER
ncbi:MAG: redoxin family protein [Pirellulales bacterium]